MDRLRPPAGTVASRRVAPVWFAVAPADQVLLDRVPIARVRHVTARPGIVRSVARALMAVEALRVVRPALATGSPGAIATRLNASHQRLPSVAPWR